MTDTKTPTPAPTAAPRYILDAECAQGKCARPTTGCWDECQMKAHPILFAGDGTVGVMGWPVTPVSTTANTDALRNIRDTAYFDSTANGAMYYRKAENALAAIEGRDAKPKPEAPASEQAKLVCNPSPGSWVSEQFATRAATTASTPIIPHELAYQPGDGEASTAYVNGWNDYRDTMMGCIPDDPTNRPATTASASARALDWYDQEQAENGINRDSFHLFVLKLIEELRASAPSREAAPLDPEARLAEAMADTDQVPHMIVFDDADRDPEIVIGQKRARYLYEQISLSWNAHLFVKIDSNSRDERHPSALLAQQSHEAAPQAPDSELQAELDELQIKFDEQNSAFEFTSLKLKEAQEEIARRDLAEAFGVATAGAQAAQPVAAPAVNAMSDDDLWHIATKVSSMAGGSLFSISQQECVTAIRASFMDPDAAREFLAAQPSAKDILRKNDPAFAAHLDRCSEVVATWPSWKQLEPSADLAAGGESIDDTTEFRELSFAYANSLCHGSVPETSKKFAALVGFINKRLATARAGNAGVAVDDLTTYPSSRGTLVRLADVKRRIAGAAPVGEAVRDGWIKMTDSCHPDINRALDVVLDNGVTLESRAWAEIDWTAVRDWRYTAAPDGVASGKGGDA